MEKFLTGWFKFFQWETVGYVAATTFCFLCCMVMLYLLFRALCFCWDEYKRAKGILK